MTEPERYLEARENGLGARLLRSAENDGPSEGSWQRALTAVGAATAITAVTGSGAASLATGTAAIWLEWLGIGLLAGTVTAFSADRLLSSDPSSRAVVPVETRHEAPAPLQQVPALPVVTAERAPETAATPARSLANPPSGVSAVPKTVADSLARELAMVDAARTRLRAGDANGTNAALDAYEKEFPRGRFGEEAGLLRAEAALLRGDCSAVRSLRRAFDGDSGKSVLGRRWQALAERCSR